jgi:cytidylate kinase
MSGFTVAIDGPGGVGKSTLARMIAGELGFSYIDTGAMYRAVALFCFDEGIPYLEAAVAARLDDVAIDIRYDNGRQRIFLCGADVSELIRTPQVAEGSSKVAVFPQVREKLVQMQRQMAMDGNVIMDGRDIGTHVLPGADVTRYLAADVEQRARRRQAELHAGGLEADFERTKAEVIERDHRDMNREFSPLRRAKDAVYLDTGEMGLEEVKNRLMEIITSRLAP